MYIQHDRDFIETKEYIENMSLAKRRFNVFYICVVFVVNISSIFCLKNNNTSLLSCPS